MTVAQLRQMQNTLPDKADRVDISGIKLDPNASAAEKAAQYFHQVKNPYHFRCGEVAVNVNFCREGKPLAQAMQSYLAAKANR